MPTTADLRLAPFDYIEAFFSRTRRHSTLGYLSPIEYEKITLSIKRRIENQTPECPPNRGRSTRPAKVDVKSTPTKRTKSSSAQKKRKSK